MKKGLLCAIAIVVFAAAGVALAGGPKNHHDGEDMDTPTAPSILAFDTMYGVDGPLLGETNAIRGVIGDEAPWAIAHFIRGRLTTAGRLTIVVRGLVFADDPDLVPPDLIGKNDEDHYRGLVSCLTEDGAGGITTANVVTDGFPADMNGNSFINQKLTLPVPCIAPIVFVMAGSEDKWFAVTGFEPKQGS
jgi:hypothetical protein